LISVADTDLQEISRNENGRENLHRIWRCLAVLAGALTLAWPSLYNGFPLLYPDSMSYLDGGRIVLRVLFQHGVSPQAYIRSLIYGLSILPFHWNVSPWGVVVLNALLTAYVIWLVVRSILPRRTVMNYFVLILSLSLFTSLGWFVSWVMPDILGPVLYLSIYLLVFAYKDFSSAELLAIILIAGWSVCSHITHLPIAAGLCIFLIPMLAVEHRLTRGRLKAIGGVAMIILAAAAATIVINTFYYGEPSLNGQRPPFLMARVIADGPGRSYLQQHCGKVQLSICARIDQLSDDSDQLLWAKEGLWTSSSPAQQRQLRTDETPLILGTLREYPKRELRMAVSNFWWQLRTLRSGTRPDPFILQTIDQVLLGARPRYLRSRQVQRSLHDDFFASVQEWTVIASAVLITAWILLTLRERRPLRLVGLAAVILFAVIANAAVTGILSEVQGRYQSRVIWLLPLLAGVLPLTWFDRRRRHSAGQESALIAAPQENALRLDLSLPHRVPVDTVSVTGGACSSGNSCCFVVGSKPKSRSKESNKESDFSFSIFAPARKSAQIISSM
jgi:hypothetical protein